MKQRVHKYWLLSSQYKVSLTITINFIIIILKRDKKTALNAGETKIYSRESMSLLIYHRWKAQSRKVISSSTMSVDKFVG